jgi:hypothetical protein
MDGAEQTHPANALAPHLAPHPAQGFQSATITIMLIVMKPVWLDR